MEHERTFTRQNVCQLARVPEEVFSFWVKRGLLTPVEGGAGKGSHRRFSLDQVRIACLLRSARDAGLNISALSFIAERASEALAVYRSYDVNPRYFLDVVTAACDIRVSRKKGADSVEIDFSYLRGFECLSDRDKNQLNVTATQMADTNPFDPLMHIGYELVHADGYLTVFRDDEGRWDLSSNSINEGGSKSTEAPAEFNLVFAMGRIMAPLKSLLEGAVA